MSTPLPAFGNVLSVPGRVLGGMTSLGGAVLRETTAVLAAIHSLPRLVVALEQLGPLADTLAETRDALRELADRRNDLGPVNDQLRALHEQVVHLACDLRVLEPDVERLAGTTSQLDHTARLLLTALDRP
ncbi:hypothetical protein EIL87_08270 [Saccharopolyspora rhizosphaerae]|uniref:Uncharacterized protein n=1 Tax=Saccharopolyspora rhizosphaerae TaxID=2492662 RepID=A0A3R8P2M1_9PSEU|nr:hypothetical protein [Saccharopolyspora rhizosphaerae]RRO18222.1 hypothetical protein EIL87_08270 [Saccharopolyspora rhizosphaerae]